MVKSNHRTIFPGNAGTTSNILTHTEFGVVAIGIDEGGTRTSARPTSTQDARW